MIRPLRRVHRLTALLLALVLPLLLALALSARRPLAVAGWPGRWAVGGEGRESQ